MTHTMHATIERDGEEIEVEVDYTVSRFYPAQTWGPPEDCSPAEGGEVEELTAYHDGKPIALTDAEIERVETRIYETHDYSE
jgi:hypothetical protein